jgi:hypothetical protein
MGILDARQRIARPWDPKWPKSGLYWTAYARESDKVEQQNILTEFDRAADEITEDMKREQRRQDSGPS